MKPDLHPGYKVITVSCACGENYQTRSTIPGDVLKTEICSKCHPHYTGQQKLIDTAGRVDKYMKKYKNFTS